MIRVERHVHRSLVSVLILLISISDFKCEGFSITSRAQALTKYGSSRYNTRHQRLQRTALQMAKSKPPPLPKTNDPFILLGLDPANPPTNPTDIKRAFRKRAMIYHPDVLTSTDSSEEERRIASEDFAKINAAYEMLTGGGTAAAASSSNAKKTSSGGYNYHPPPHRRSGSYKTKSTNWEDFMPNYEKEDSMYDAGGDSFGAIFSDLMKGVAVGAAGLAGSRGGIMNDLIEFLESNIDGFSSGYDDDTSLERLLSTGSYDEVANEMDEIDVLVTSLEKKLSSVQDEVMQLQADLGYATKYSEKIDLEERIAELKAREKVVSGYLKKGRSRLVRLRERYKELVVQGRGGRGYDTNRSTSNSRKDATGRTASSTSYESTPSTSPSSSASSSTESKSWRTEGFGGAGRRSSSSRRSSRRSGVASENDSDNKYQSSPNQERKTTQQSSLDESSSGSYNADRSTLTSSRTESWTPPHRRTQSTTQQIAEEKRRLRELKVDDEFEKLKREMGNI
jgi:hypothetical protein